MMDDNFPEQSLCVPASFNWRHQPGPASATPLFSSGLSAPDAPFFFSWKKKKKNHPSETYQGWHRKNGTSPEFLIVNLNQHPHHPQLSRAAKLMRDATVRRLRRPQACALETVYPGVWDDKTFRPIWLAAHWQPETKEQPRRNLKSLNECQLISQDRVELIRI